MPGSTRGEALISIAACGVAAQALDAADHEPETSVANQFRLLEQLDGIIIPGSDALGARNAGVAAMIDEGAAEIGLIQEVGHQGSTYLAEFPGCQHEEHA